MLDRCWTAQMLLKFRGRVGWDYPSLCSGLDALKIRTHAHTEAPFVAVTDRISRKYGYCYSVAATASKANGVMQTQQQQTA